MGEKAAEYSVVHMCWYLIAVLKRHGYCHAIKQRAALPSQTSSGAWSRKWYREERVGGRGCGEGKGAMDIPVELHFLGSASGQGHSGHGARGSAETFSVWTLSLIEMAVCAFVLSK